MRKKLEDYELFPESEGSEKKQILWNKWREGFKKNNKEWFNDDPDAANTALEEYMDDKRRRKLKQIDDRVEYNEFEAAGKLDELDEDNFFHPKNQVGNSQYDSAGADDTNTGLVINMRPQLAVNIMKVEFPEEIVAEINDHIDNVIIPNDTDHSKGLVGQINRNEKSKQLTFPHKDDDVGQMFAGVLETLAKQYVQSTLHKDCRPELDSMWTVHSYEGDYNPLHDHGTKTTMGVSCIFYLKVPEQISNLTGEVSLNNSSGATDGFTYLTWGTNGSRDVNMLRPITEEYIKPIEGTLIMFPSWLRHSVNPFFGEGERRTFSANISINPISEGFV